MVNEHTACLSGGCLLDVAALIDRVGRNAWRWRTLSSLGAELLDRSQESGFCPLRYAACDPVFAVLVDRQGRLIDGRHRLCKLHDLKFPYVRVIEVSDADLLACRLT